MSIGLLLGYLLLRFQLSPSVQRVVRSHFGSAGPVFRYHIFRPYVCVFLADLGTRTKAQENPLSQLILVVERTSDASFFQYNDSTAQPKVGASHVLTRT